VADPEKFPSMLPIPIAQQEVCKDGRFEIQVIFEEQQVILFDRFL